MTGNGTLSKQRRFGLSILAFSAIASLSSAPVAAQTLDAPATVCLGDEFDVIWTGPGGDGDLITVAEANFPADQSLTSGATAGGSPTEIDAPAQEGFFEVRYVQADPKSIVVRRGIIVQNCLSSTAGTGASGASGSSGGVVANPEYTAGPDQAVLVSGIATNYGDVVSREGHFGDQLGTIDALCDNSGVIGWAMGAIIDTIEQSMVNAGSPITFDAIEQLPDAPTRAGIEESLRTVRDEMCDREEKPPEVQPFTITYAYCRMAMVTPWQVMDIHLPPSTGTGTMTAADYQTGEAMQVTLQRSFDAAAMVVGTGWSSQVAMTSPASGGSRIGYPTTRYAYEHTGGLGGGGMVPFAGMVSTENKGTVWVSEAVPGLDIIRTFYENLSAEVSPEQGGGSFFAGLLNNLVGMLQNGLPLEIDQTISSKVMGRTSISGRTHSIVTGIQLVDFRPEWCSESLIPSTMAVQDIDQQMSDAMSQSGVSQQEVSEAMQQYNEAMQNMTPQQKQMMEQYGMGDMLQNMMGGAAAPGGMQQSAPTGSRPPSGGTAGSNMPPSEELQSGSVTESVQKHLQALGYDVGDVNGEVSLETSIAISTFQAEQGIKVTGEVSPQLLGILSAEVDRRR